MKPAFFKSAADFRAWLDQHHATGNELLVGFYRKESGRGITYPEALDEALAFGWIDGVRKRMNAEAYTIRFTPRKTGSVWSAVNIRRVRALMGRGLMKPPGLRAFEERDERKAGLYSYEREHAKLDPVLEAALRANRQASSFFDAQPPGYRKVATFWVMSAKKEETRSRRLARLMECSGRGKRIDALSPNRD
ncbi:MAG TPA: YdeI/OmpD-associated family protein [Bryobacteraceae bacterium]|nr:YdeI/OmpD-associated family protein [Bryobacteraceae bacterium]